MTNHLFTGLPRLIAALGVALPFALACSGGTTTTSTTSTTGTSTAGTTTGGSTGTTTSGTGTGSGSGTTTGTSTGGLPDGGCDCPVDKHCDPGGSGQCLDCLADSDCTAPQVCQSSSSYLDYGKCVQCSEAEPTCPAGQICDLSLGHTYHTCVAHCTQDGGIPPCPNDAFGRPQHCSATSGTCVTGCASDIDCAPGDLHCDTSKGSCVSCLTPLDCPYSNPGCDQGTCGYCTDNAHCPAGLVCDSFGSCTCPDGGGCGGDAPVCVDLYKCGCVSNADCAGLDEVCSGDNTGSKCIPPCTDGGTMCTWDQYCYPDSGLCGACQDDSQCVGFDAGAHCFAYGPTFGYCGCQSNSDCGDIGACTPMNNGTSQCALSCLIDGGTDCASLGNPYMAFCDPITGVCGPCSDNSQCAGNPAGWACVNGTCACNVAADCDGGLVCDSTQCTASCLLDGGTDCSSHYYQYCDPSTGVCSPCTSDDQCLGNDAGARCLTESTQNCGCRDRTDCASDQGCDRSFLVCVPSCLVDGGTVCVDMVCDPNALVCVQCLDDSQCTSTTGTPFCQSDIDAGNYCVQCLKPSDCPDTTPGCGFFTCGYCQTETDCPSIAPLCHNFLCVSSCVLPDGGTYCASGVCDTSSTFCVDCLQDGDCQPDAGAPFCSADIDAGNFCAQCLKSADCGDAGPCSSQFLQCGFCSVDGDCPSDAPTCNFGTCSDAGP